MGKTRNLCTFKKHIKQLTLSSYKIIKKRPRGTKPA